MCNWYYTLYYSYDSRTTGTMLCTIDMILYTIVMIFFTVALILCTIDTSALYDWYDLLHNLYVRYYE